MFDRKEIDSDHQPITVTWGSTKSKDVAPIRIRSIQDWRKSAITDYKQRLIQNQEQHGNRLQSQ